MRKLLTKILSVIVALTATIGLVTLPKTSVLASEENFTFGAVAGAGVKYGETLDETGLRFTIEVDKNFYATLPSNVEFGALISTKNYVSETLNGNLVLNENDDKIADVRYVTDATKFDRDQPAENKNHVYYASITYRFDDKWKEEVLAEHRAEMPNASDDEIFEYAKLEALATDLVCRPYYIIGEEVVYASLSNPRSMVKVANSAIIDGDPITSDFVAKYLSTVVESTSEVFVEADGTVIGLSTKDKEMLASSDSITLDGNAGDSSLPFNGDKVELSFLEDKELGEYYYITAFDGANGYRIKYMFVTKAIDEAEDLHIFTLKGATEDNQYNEVGGYYVVTKDIDASSLVLNEHVFMSNAVYPGNGYNADRGFTGVLDGLGHTINNLSVKSNGLFGQGNAMTVKNVAFTNAKLSGYYTTLFAHQITRGKDINNAFTHKEGYFENVYVSVASIAPGARVGILVNNGLPTAVKVKNVIVEYLNVDSAVQAQIDAGKNFYMFGTSKNSLVNNPDAFENSFSISTAPVLYFYEKNSAGVETKLPGFAENQVEFTLSEDGKTIASVGKVLDEQVNTILGYHNTTLTTDHVIVGLRAYDNYEEMARDSQANADKLATFSDKYWIIVNGVPYWKSSYDNMVRLAVEDRHGNLVNPSEISLNNNATEYTVRLFDSTHEITNLTILGEGLVQVGNKFKLENNPMGNGTTEVTVVADVNGIEIKRTFTVSYTNEVQVDGKVLYSDDDNSLDLTSLNKALMEEGQESIKLSDIDGYIVNGNQTDLLDLEVIITGTARKRVVDRAQQVTILVGDRVYLLNNVYAYTKLIDEAEDLHYFTLTGATEDNPYNERDGYFLVTKNIDGSQIVLKNHVFMSGASYPGNGYNADVGLKGVFDGQGYVIDGLTIPSTGIFGNTNAPIIRDIAITNANLTGYYPTALAMSFTRSKTYTNNFTGYEALIENVYISVSSIATGGSSRIGIVSNQNTYAGVSMKNVIVEYTNVSEAVQKQINNAKPFYMFGSNGGSMANSKIYTDCYGITTAPILSHASYPGFAENQVEYTLTGNKVTAVGNILDSKVNEILALHGKTLTVDNVLRGIRAYDNYEAMANDATANAASLATFGDSWVVKNGVPYWKEIYLSNFEVQVKQDDKVISGTPILKDTSAELTLDILDNGGNPIEGVTVTAPDGLIVNGNTIKLVNKPDGKGSYEVKVSAIVEGVVVEKWITVNYSNEVIVEGKVLYSQYDKSLDLPSLNKALNEIGVEDITFEDISGYIINEEEAEELNLEVIISGGLSGDDRAVDTAQEVSIKVGKVAYKLSVYAYTRLIDEVEDLSWFSKQFINIGEDAVGLEKDIEFTKGVVSSVDSVYAQYPGYYLMTKNLDGSNYAGGEENYKLEALREGQQSHAATKGLGLTGVFDGNGYTISSIIVPSRGVLGAVTAGTVKNVAFKDMTLTGYYQCLVAHALTNADIDPTVSGKELPTLMNVYIEGTNVSYTGSNGEIGIICQNNFFGYMKNVIVKHDVSEGEIAKLEQGKHWGIFNSQYFYGNGGYDNRFSNVYFITDGPISFSTSTNNTWNKFLVAGNVVKVNEDNKYELVDATKFALLNSILTSEKFTWETNVITADTLWNVDVLRTIKQYVDTKDMAADNNNYANFSSDYWTIVNGVPVWKSIAFGEGHAHIYEEDVTEPTCKEEGYTTYTCPCGYSYVGNYVEALGHTEVIDKGYDATCTTSGLTDGKYCSVCGEVLATQTVIPEKGHTEVIDKAVEPTCTTSGLTEGKHCSVCGEVLIPQTVIPEKGHTEVVDKAVEPTCTTTGLTEGKHCSVCGEVLEEQVVIPENGHDYNEVVTKPTCTDKGYTTYTCHCGDTYVDNYVDALGHDYDEVVTKPTCTDKGYTTYTCHCGDTYVGNYVDALGHTEVIDKAVEPTCTTTGLTEGKHCSVCNKVLIERTVIPTKAHTEVIDKAVEPTCTTTGLTEGKHCSVCNAILEKQVVIPANGHTEVIDKGIEPTCTTTGLTEGKHCSVCGEILIKQNVIPATGVHNYNEEVIVPTCETRGYTVFTCACGDSYIGAYVDPIGHAYGEFVSNGNDTHSAVCANDNTHVLTEDCRGGVATLENRAVCEVCFAEYGLLNHVHNYTEQNVDSKYLKTPATCDTKAVYYYSCACGVIGKDTFEYGEALGHALGEIISNGNGTHEVYCANDRTHKVTQSCSGTPSSDPTAPIVCDLCGKPYANAILPEIQFKKESVTLTIGEFVTVGVKKNYIEGLKVEYYSEDNSVATVDAYGRIEAIYDGTTYVVAKYGNATAKCKIVVESTDLTPVLIDLYGFNEVYNVYKNTSFNFYPAIRYMGRIYTDAVVTFTSTNENIVSFEGNVLKTNATSGSVDCYAEAVWKEYNSQNSRYLRFDFTVVVLKEAYVALKSTSADYIEIYTHSEFDGKAYKNTNEFIPEFYVENEKVEGAEINYAFENSSIFDLNDGVITAKTYGNAKIELSCEYEGFKYVKNIYVKVIRPEAEFEINGPFSSEVGTFKDVEDDYIDKTIVNKIYGTDSVALVEAKQGVKPLTFEDNKILGLNPNGNGAYNTIITISTETEIYHVALKVYGLYIMNTDDLAVFSTKFEYRGYYYLANDIDATDFTMPKYGTGNGGERDGYGLYGKFEGNGHVISNLTVNTGGIFGGIYNGTVQNVAFTGVKLTGYYPCLIAHKEDGSTTLKNMYVQIDSIGVRGGGLFQQGMSPSAIHENIIVEYGISKDNVRTIMSKVGDAANISTFAPNRATLYKDTMFVNCFSISYAPIGCSSPNGTDFSWTSHLVAENQVTLGDLDENGKTILIGVTDWDKEMLQATTPADFLKTKAGVTHVKDSGGVITKPSENVGTEVIKGIKAYHTISDLKADKTINAEILKTFSEDYWIVVDGVPVWKKIICPEHDYKIEVYEPTCAKGGYTTYTCKNCNYTYNSNYTSALEHNYGATEIVAPTCESVGYTIYSCSYCNHSYVDNYLDALGHKVSSGRCTVCGETSSEQKVLYSQYDKQLDLPSLRNALAFSGVTISSLDDITYVVNGVETNQLELDVIITGKTVNRNVTTAQTVKVKVGDRTITLTNVYAYTRLIDELTDLDWISRPTETQEDGTVLYDNYDGYYLLTKNLTGKGLGGNTDYRLAGATGIPGSNKTIGLTGVFDGNGYTISNCIVQSKGIFGYVKAGVIKNVGFKDMTLTGYYSCLLAHDLVNYQLPGYTSNQMGGIYNIYVEGTKIPYSDSCNGAAVVLFQQNFYGYSNNVVVKHNPSKVEKEHFNEGQRSGIISHQYNTSYDNHFTNWVVIGDVPFAYDESSSRTSYNKFVFASNQLKLKNGSTTEYEMIDPTAFAFTNSLLNKKKNEELVWKPVLEPKDGFFVIDIVDGVKQYANEQEMAKEESANATMLATFNTDYWSITNGVPVWKSSRDIVVHEHSVVVEKGIDATCTESGISDGKHCSVCGEILAVKEKTPAIGHNYSDWMANPNGGYYRVCANDASHKIYAEHVVEEKVLYSKDDKSLDLPSLKSALSDLGVIINSLDDIDGYIVHDKNVNVLDLDVIISGTGANRVVDTAQTIVVIINGELYLLPNVYAYTKLIDEARDLESLLMTKDNSQVQNTGYYMMTKNIVDDDYVLPNNVFGKGYSYPITGDMGFYGVFDGNGYAIEGIKIGSSGLFGQVKTAIIRNVAFINVEISGNYPCLIAHSMNGGTIKNIYVEGTRVSAGNIGILFQNNCWGTVNNVVVRHTLGKAVNNSNELDNILNKKQHGIFGLNTTFDYRKNSTVIKNIQNVYVLGDIPVAVQFAASGTRNNFVFAGNVIKLKDGFAGVEEKLKEYELVDPVTFASLQSIWTNPNYTWFNTPKMSKDDIQKIDFITNIKQYIDDKAMAQFATANADSLATFDSEYWNVVNGVPYWKHKHAFDVVVTAPTCDKQGSVAHVCDCGLQQVDKYFDALGHTIVIDQAVEPTCTTTGLTEGKHCSTCGEILVKQQVIPANGHTYSTIVSKPTCEEQGYTIFYCDCGYRYKGNFVDALGHNFVEVTSNGDGTHSKVCANDNSHVVVEDCYGGIATETGKAVCELCNSEYGAPLTHSHKFINQTITNKYLVTPATCEGKAVYYYSCDCGAIGTETFEYGVALGHAYGEPINNYNGTHSRVCGRDNSHVVVEDCYGDTACEECNQHLINIIIGTAGLEYEIVTDRNGAKYAVCTGIGTATETEIVIASHYQGYIVKEIAQYAFKKNANVTSVEMVNGLETIGMFAFQGSSSLASVILPETLTNICQNAFEGCENLLNVRNDSQLVIKKGENGNGMVGNYACNIYSATSGETGEYLTEGDFELYVFPSNKYVLKYNGTLANVVFPENVTGIYKDAFKGNATITEVTIPASVEYIGKGAFANCTALTKVTFASGTKIKEFGTMAFAGCTALKEFNYNNTLDKYFGIEFANDTSNPLNFTKTITINGQKPTVLEIPNGIKTINGCAFVGCGDIQTIVIPESVEVIKPFAFARTSVVSIEFSGVSKLRNIENNAFAHCTKLEKLNLPRSVEFIGVQAFVGCSSLKSLTFENNNNLETISQRAFASCIKLESVFIGHNSSLKEIGNEAFYNCYNYDKTTRTHTGLTYFSFGNNSKVESIGGSAFMGCRLLKEIYIPASCLNIGNYCFSGCFQGDRGDPEDLQIYAESATRPMGWLNEFNSSNNIIHWGVKYPTLPDDFSFES